MLNELTLKVNNLGIIDNAELSIGKINIIGGHNSSGKSTLSKVLYCFLKSNSIDGKKLAIIPVVDQIDHFIRRSNIQLGPKVYEDMIYIVQPIVTPSNNIHPIFDKKANIETVRMVYDHLLTYLRNYFSENQIINKSQYESLKDSKLFKGLNIECIDSEETSVTDKLHFILLDFLLIDELIAIIENNPKELYSASMKKLLDSEFDIKKAGDLNANIHLEGPNFSYFVDLNNLSFKSEGLFEIESIYYIDSISLLDSKSKYSEHVNSLIDAIRFSYTTEIFEGTINKQIIDIENKVNSIINGNLKFSKGQFEFLSNEGVLCSMQNTASGIKQLGIVQLLLANRKLKPGDFLIIDEPEVNLHPEWQVKFAEILVLLAKELDLIIYINSHSPIFIKAIKTYSEYYDLIDDVNFYISELGQDGYSFNKLDPVNLHIIYEELGTPYDVLNNLEIKSRFKNRSKRRVRKTSQ